MPETFPSTVPGPTYKGSSGETSARVLKSGFGDGYEQRAGDGINNVVTSWSLVWENLTWDEASTIWGFLNLRGGWQAFYWTNPGGSQPVLWVCEKWSAPTPVAPGVFNMSASFMQVFDLV